MLYAPRVSKHTRNLDLRSYLHGMLLYATVLGSIESLLVSALRPKISLALLNG